MDEKRLQAIQRKRMRVRWIAQGFEPIVSRKFFGLWRNIGDNHASAGTTHTLHLCEYICRRKKVVKRIARYDGGKAVVSKWEPGNIATDPCHVCKRTLRLPCFGLLEHRMSKIETCYVMCLLSKSTGHDSGAAAKIEHCILCRYAGEAQHPFERIGVRVTLGEGRSLASELINNERVVRCCVHCRIWICMQHLQYSVSLLCRNQVC